MKIICKNAPNPEQIINISDILGVNSMNSFLFHKR